MVSFRLRERREKNTSHRITTLLCGSIVDRLFPTFQLMGGTSSSVDPGSTKENKLIDCSAKNAECLDASVQRKGSFLDIAR